MRKNIYYLILCIVLAFSIKANAQITLIDPTAGGGFELGNTFALNGWTEIQAGPVTTANKWFVGTAPAGVNAGVNGAYISDDGGVSNHYDVTQARVQFFYQTVNFPAIHPTIVLTFNWKGEAEAGANDRMRVYLVPSTYTVTASVQIPNLYRVGDDDYNVQSTWQSESITLPSSLSGTTQKLVFGWANNGSIGNQPPIAVDNISLVAFPPPPPANDNCIAAIGLTSGAACTFTSGTTYGATQSSGPSATCAAADTEDDVWYSFVATQPDHHLKVHGVAGFDAGFAVYSGTCGSLTTLTCVNAFGSGLLESTSIQSLTVGNTYFVRVFSMAGSTAFDFNICLQNTPLNDNCAGAIAIPTGVACTYTAGTTDAASQSSQTAPTCASTDIDDDVWYSFVANQTDMAVKISGSVGFDAAFAVYSGTCGTLTSLTCVNASGLAAIETTTLHSLTIGNTYFVRVFGVAGSYLSNFQICVNYPPVNNDCAGAISLPTGIACTYTSGNTDGADQSDVLPPAFCSPTGANDDVWYSFVADSSHMKVNVSGAPGFDPSIAIYTGTCTTLTYVICGDATVSTDETLALPYLIVGQTYYVRVYSTSPTPTSANTFQICATYMPPPPPNDNCVNAQLITTGSACVYTNGTTLNATNYIYPLPTPAGDPVTSCASTGTDDDVWYKFVADQDAMTVKVLGAAGFDAAYSVYSGSCNALTEIACVNATASGQVELDNVTALVVGNTYYIRVYTAGSLPSPASTFQICVNYAPSPTCINSNPFCSTAAVPYEFPATVNAGSGEPGPDYGCLSTQPNPAWYYMQMATSGPVVINIHPTTPRDIDFAVWGPFTDQDTPCTAQLTGDCVGNHNCSGNIVDCSYIGGTADETVTIPNAIAGEFYLFLLTNFSNQPTNVQFNQTNLGDPNAGLTNCDILCNTPVPTATTPIKYCKNATANPLTATGTDLRWYLTPVGGTSLTTTPTPVTTATGLQYYYVSQTIGSCQSIRKLVTVEVLDITTATITVTDGVCQDNAGAITVNSITGGEAPYTYSFNGAPFVGFNSITGLPTTAVYSLTIKDSNGCSYVTTKTVTSEAGPTSFTITKTNATCGLDDGAISVGSVIDGVSPYQFSYNGGVYTTNSNFTGLPIGNYAVTVKDNNACSYTANANIVNIGAATDIDIAVSNSTCGLSNGSVALSNVVGGTAPFSYSFNGSVYSTSTSITGIASTLTSYTLSVKDNIGCTYVETFTITNIPGPTSFSVTKANPTCGNSNGEFDVATITGGTTPYLYSFNGQAFGTTHLVTGLNPGTYTITVQDNNLCTYTNTTVLNNISGPSTYTTTVTNTTCGNSNGKVVVSNVVGGTLPYTYNFNNAGFVSNPTFTGLQATTYSLVVKDANGCELIGNTISIQNIDGPSAATYTTNFACNSSPNGKITVTNVAGGTAPYTYQFNGGAFINNPQFTGLAASTYTLAIKDANGCIYSTNYTIESNSPTATISGGGVICAGIGSVTINVNLLGGAPWTLTYNNGISDNTVTGITSSPYTFATTSAGTYTLVSVKTENDNCLTALSNANGSALAVVNDIPVAPTTSDVKYCMGVDSLKFESIGSSTALYNWYHTEVSPNNLIESGSSATFFPPSIAQPGEYNYYVTQTVNGCVSAPSAIKVTAKKTVAEFTVTPTYGERPLFVQTDNLSTGATNYTWDFGNGVRSDLLNPSTTFEEDGEYTVLLTASNEIGCQDTMSVNIKVEANYLVIIPNVFSPNNDPSNINETLKITYRGVQSVEGYIYNRWGKKVYDITSINDEWNGKVKGDGSNASDGVYYLLLNVKPIIGDVKEYNKAITLIR